MDEKTVEKIKQIIGTNLLKSTGKRSAGCINEGEAYEVDNGFVFIKKNNKEHAKVMFESEFASLKAIEKTQTVRVPHPFGVVSGTDEWYFCVLEFLPMRSLHTHAAQLGHKLAQLHLHNETMGNERITKFGFFRTTCVGMLTVNNTWTDDWTTFYTNRLEEQIQRTNDKDARNNWAQLRPLMPRFFENLEVKPSLLHGDLWTGNVAETEDEPVIFDPGSVYGHHEFDLAMTTLFGSLNKRFYDAYHSEIPKARGFDVRRKLYHLFHLLNHWNHFGGGYREQSLSTMKTLLKTKFPL